MYQDNKKTHLVAKLLTGSMIVVFLVVILLQSMPQVVSAHAGAGFTGGKGNCKFVCQNTNTSGGGATNCNPQNGILDQAKSRPPPEKDPNKDAVHQAHVKCHSNPCGTAAYSGSGGSGSTNRCSGMPQMMMPMMMPMMMMEMMMGMPMMGMPPMMMPPMMMPMMMMPMPMMMEPKRKGQCIPTYPGSSRGEYEDGTPCTVRGKCIAFAAGSARGVTEDGVPCTTDAFDAIRDISATSTATTSNKFFDEYMFEEDIVEEEPVEETQEVVPTWEEVGSAIGAPIRSPSKLALPNLQPTYSGPMQPMTDSVPASPSIAQEAINAAGKAVQLAVENIKTGATDVAAKLLDAATKTLAGVAQNLGIGVLGQ